MYRFEDVRLRKFRFEDIPLKIKWINDPANNRYLHYDLPLEYEKTCRWYEAIKDREDRFDAVVEYLGEPVGLFGLLNIDYKNKKAEDYSLIGDLSVKGKGIGAKAGILNVIHGFHDLGLNKIYGYIEAGNTASVRRWTRMGGSVEGLLKESRYSGGQFIDEYFVGFCRRQFLMPEDVYWEDDET